MGATTYAETEAAAEGAYDQYDSHEPQEMREAYVPYRALSRTAVASVIIGLLGLSALTAVPLLVLPALGLLLGMWGLRTIRRYPIEYSGRAVATAGIVGNALLLLGASTLHTAIYLTEVPEGATRISFRELQPTKQAPELPVSPRALELDGQRVFVKGYVYPDGQQHGIRRFVMVPDLGTCCFGGQPKLTHMMEVTLRDPHRTYYSTGKRSLAGILRVDSNLKPVSGLGGVYFQLDADYVR
jgi:hypothetical protein